MRKILFLAAGALIVHGGPVIARLGFYHDDWPILDAIGSIGGGLGHLVLEQVSGSVILYRPLSVLCWTLPYWLFGLRAPLWHLLMAGMTCLLGWSVSRVLREHGLPDSTALLGALLFMAFPNKDATVFWPDVSLILSTSLLAFLVSYLLHNEYLKNGRGTFLFSAAVFMGASLCSYDQTFFLLPVWLLAPAASPDRRRRMTRSLSVCGGVILALMLYKFVLLPFWIPQPKTVRLSFSHAGLVYYLALRAVADPRWILYLLRCAWQAVSWSPLMVLAAAFLPWAARWGVSAEERLQEGAGRGLILFGAVVYVLGNLPLCFSDYAPGAYDHMNRLNQLPAVGIVAMLCGAAAGRLRSFALPVCTAFCLVVHIAFAEIWAESYRLQLRVRDAVVENLAVWDARKTLLVQLPDLYVSRKAPVFLSDYDVSAAIRLWTGDRGRRAVVYAPWVKVEADGLRVGKDHFPYGTMEVLDMRAGTLLDLDRRRAHALPLIVEPWLKPLEFPAGGPSI